MDNVAVENFKAFPLEMKRELLCSLINLLHDKTLNSFFEHISDIVTEFESETGFIFSGNIEN